MFDKVKLDEIGHWCFKTNVCLETDYTKAFGRLVYKSILVKTCKLFKDLEPEKSSTNFTMYIDGQSKCDSHQEGHRNAFETLLNSIATDKRSHGNGPMIHILMR